MMTTQVYTPYPTPPTPELTQLRHSREDVHVPVDDGDGDPGVLAREHGLLGDRARLIGGELDHAQFGAQGGRVLVPAEVGLIRVRLGELLHELKRLLVQHQRQPEGLGDGLVGDVVVTGG
jgi:hypothetical protein